MIQWIENLLNRSSDILECDHIFYPHYDETVSKHPIGQSCILCNQFNSNESLGLKNAGFSHSW